LNPNAEAQEPKSCMSANSIMPAYFVESEKRTVHFSLSIFNFYSISCICRKLSIRQSQTSSSGTALHT